MDRVKWILVVAFVILNLVAGTASSTSKYETTTSVIIVETKSPGSSDNQTGSVTTPISWGTRISCMKKVRVYAPHMTQDQSLCLCFNRCTEDSTSVMPVQNNKSFDSNVGQEIVTTPKSNDDDGNGHPAMTSPISFGTGQQCLVKLRAYDPSTPKEKYWCICFNRCPQPTTNENLTDPVTHTGVTKSLFISQQECMDKLLKEKPDVRQKEYLCLCFNKCLKNDEEIRNLHGDEAAKIAQNEQGAHLYIKIVMYILIFVLGLLGNILVIVTVSGFMGRMTVTNIYILNLAVADLMVILICVPTKAYESIEMQWEFSHIGCKLIAMLYFGSFMCSVFTLVCMALERYMVINHPMRSQMLSSTKRTLVIITGVWIVGILLSLPTAFLAESKGQFRCSVSPNDQGKRFAFYMFIFIAIFFVPSCLMGFSYVRTSITLWISIKQQQKMKTSGTSANGKHDTSGRGQVIRVLIAVLIVFIICWAPYLSLQVYLATDKHKHTSISKTTFDHISIWFNFLSLANSCLNPILYGALSRQFRMGFLRCLTCRKKGMEPAKSYITATTSGGAMTARSVTNTNTHQMTSLKDSKKHNSDAEANNGINQKNGDFKEANRVELQANGNVIEENGNAIAENNNITDSEVHGNVVESKETTPVILNEEGAKVENIKVNPV